MTEPDRPPVGTRLTRIGWETPEGLDETMIRAVVDEFYARARRDDVIGPVFNRIIPDAEWPAHLDKIADFWSSMLLGTGRYTGRPMPKHMDIPELADAHFMRWLRLFRETVEALCPPEIAALFIERSERIGNSFRMNIHMRRGEDIVGMEPLRREAPPVWVPK
ncbi:group III truncated hemoglobin [Devosia faecipullorum]|uniref:group III truncated hemoglobin n=1 Tax=Devosia faecipullorum TaxID=2755039 RepID=UPI00187B82B9|nr:group III truncated hemoglobin [Devosia faecipullorum]MBE7733583.1 group III truncated hemoglobin [Devosia faecipullorum]